MSQAPGYLHFNLQRGCRAEMLNACMAKFLGGITETTSLFKSLDMSDLICEVSEENCAGLHGTMVNFYIAGFLVGRNSDWQSSSISTSSKNQFLQACLRDQDLKLSDIRNALLDSKIPPSISALATRTLDNILKSSASDRLLSGQNALWLFCHLLMLSAQVVALDPKFISASRVFVGNNTQIESGAHSRFNDPHLINELLINVLAVETDTAVEIDILALSFIKSLAGHFGARGANTILATAIGFSPNLDPLNPCLVEALWCEAHLPDSISEKGPSAKARVSFLYEVAGRVAMGFDMALLCRMLAQHGAISQRYSIAHDEKNISHHVMSFLVGDDQKREAIEAFLIKGEASDVRVREVESHELKRRIVSVPMGSGNKTYSCRFYEYIYLDKTLRVEPLAQDLRDYIKKTNYSADVARSDMLFAWKKWRQRVAES